jgi:hypothetical protein
VVASLDIFFILTISFKVGSTAWGFLLDDEVGVVPFWVLLNLYRFGSSKPMKWSSIFLFILEFSAYREV